MAHPVTFYVSTLPIQRFVEQYGETLERLAKSEKLLLIALITESLSGGAFEFKQQPDVLHRPEFLREAVRLVELSDEDAIQSLLFALVTQVFEGVYAPS